MLWARDKMTPKSMRTRWINFCCIFEQIGISFLAEGMAFGFGKCDSHDWGYTNSWLDLSHIHLFNKAMKFNVGQSFCKVIYNHLVGWNVEKLYPFWCHLITNVVVLDIDMLSLWVENWVVCQGYQSLIIAFQWDDNFSSPTHNVKVVFNCMSACIVLGDLDKRMLLVWL